MGCLDKCRNENILCWVKSKRESSTPLAIPKADLQPKNTLFCVCKWDWNLLSCSLKKSEHGWTSLEQQNKKMSRISFLSP